MQRVRQPNRYRINADRAKALLQAIRRRIERGEASHPELRADAFKAFEDFFTNLSKPTTESKPLVATGLRSPKDYSDLIDSFKADIDAAAEDSRNLSNSIVSSFNVGTVLSRQLDARVKKVTSKSQDLQLLTEDLVEDTVVAGDDFADDSRLDRDMTLEVAQAELPKTDNQITLLRQSGENVLDAGNVTIRILSSLRIYEGKFYAPNGEARPEGNSFHFTGADNSLQTDATAPGAPSDLLKRFNNWRSDPSGSSTIETPEGQMKRSDVTAKLAYRWSKTLGGWGPFSNAEWDMLANNWHKDAAFTDEPGLLNPLGRAVTYDKGAPMEERAANRQNMVDNNPDTFWECEFVIDSSEALLTARPATSTQPEGIGSDADHNQLGSQVGNSPPEEDGSDTGGQITLGQLIDRIASPAIDKLDMDCTIILELPEVKVINWITLLPHNFSDATWLEVLDVSTSVDGAEWDEVDGLRDAQHENILTPETNAELTPHEVSVTLAPNKFQYSGQGVWAFQAREAKFVRIKLLQKTPIPAPYDIMKVDMSRTLTATHTGHRGTSSTNYQQNKLETLSYLDTLKVNYGEKALSGLGDPAAKSVNITRESGGTTADVFRDILDPGRFLHAPSQEASTTHQYTGWSVKERYYETKWDKARYAIGIKEIGAYAYIYSDKAGFVSVPFRAPKPIVAVSLYTDEITPEIFGETAVRPWIKYWVSFNDGQSWTPIAPANQAVNWVDGIDARIPQTIHVNSGIPEEERDLRTGYVDLGEATNQIRLKAVLERPSQYADMTPILKAYRLRMVMRGGL